MQGSHYKTNQVKPLDNSRDDNIGRTIVDPLDSEFVETRHEDTVVSSERKHQAAREFDCDSESLTNDEGPTHYIL